MLRALIAPFEHFFSRDGELFWPYLAGFVLLGAVVWLSRGRPGGLVTFLFPPALYRTPSAQVDIRYFFVNVPLYAVIVAPLLVSTVQVARVVSTGLVHAFGAPEAPLLSGPIAAISAAGVLVVAGDLGFFVSHYLHHKVPALWVFHKIHHSAEALNPLTAFRSHPVNIAVDWTITTTVSGAASAVLAYLFDAPLTLAMVLGVNIFSFAFHAAGAHLRHSHIWLGYGPIASRFLVSPGMHQLHHSTAIEHRDKNFGGVFAIWDGLCGTLVIPPQEIMQELGLENGESKRYRRVFDLYLRPLQDLAHMARRRLQTLLAR